MSSDSAEALPLNVLWLTSSYPRSEDDSASIFLRYLAENLALSQVKVHILAPDHPDVANFSLPDSLTLSHFQYFFPPRFEKLAYGSGILPNLRAEPWLYLQVPFFIFAMFISATWAILRRRPELIHAHWIFPQGTVAVVLGKLFRIPVIVTAHGGDAFALKGGVLSRVKRWTVQLCAMWTSNTLATAKAIASSKRFCVIPMGIDFQSFSSGTPKHLGFSQHSHKLILLFVGRLVAKKGMDSLIRAIAKLPDDHRKRIDLWVVGDGIERARLESLAKDLRVEGNVFFYGKVPNKQLPAYYAAADIFVAPSVIDSDGDTEGQGVILLEAMASGTPVIASDIGGIGEVIDNGRTGVLVPAGNSEQLAEAISALLLDPVRRQALAQAGKEIAKTYDWRLIADKFYELYRQVSVQ